MTVLRNIVSIFVTPEVVGNCRFKGPIPFFFTHTIPMVAVRWVETLFGVLEFLFLGTFANFEKRLSTSCFSVRPSVLLYVCLSVCLSVWSVWSVCTEQLGSHRTAFHEILYLTIFRKSVYKIQASLKSKNNKYITGRPMYIYENISPKYS